MKRTRTATLGVALAAPALACGPVLLEDPDWDGPYHDHIHPAFAVPQGGQDQQRCSFVTGPQGSGKTTILHRMSAELGPDVIQGIVPDALLARIDTLTAGNPHAKAAGQADRNIHCTAISSVSPTTPSHSARTAFGTV